MENAVKVWRRQQKNKGLLEKEGTIITWTRIVVAPPAFANYTPYVVVLVELTDKSRVYGQLVDFIEEDLKFGQKVKAVLRRAKDVSSSAVIEYGIKFKPTS